jgi:hypothetical protein
MLSYLNQGKLRAAQGNILLDQFLHTISGFCEHSLTPEDYTS